MLAFLLFRKFKAEFSGLLTASKLNFLKFYKIQKIQNFQKIQKIQNFQKIQKIQNFQKIQKIQKIQNFQKIQRIRGSDSLIKSATQRVRSKKAPPAKFSNIFLKYHNSYCV